MKVFAVEYTTGDGSHFVDCLFTTRELAEAYSIDKARRELGGNFAEPGERSFADWYRAHAAYEDVGDVFEYDLWDSRP